MFYDTFLSLCNAKGVKPSRALTEASVPKSALTYWKNEALKGVEAVPTNQNILKLAEYFGCSVDYLLTGESPAPAGLDESGYDLDAKEKALLTAFNELTEEGKDLSIEYTQMLGTQNKYKKFALPDAESVG